MHIALDTQSTIGRPTGIGQYTSHLLAALRHVAPQHTYLEVAWGKAPSMRLHNRLLWQQFQAPYRARTLHADLLHTPGFDAPFWKPCPVVLTCHDLIGMIFPRNLPPVARLYWARWLPYSVRFADAVIADSQATQEDMVRLLGLDPARIKVIPLGVDLAIFEPQCTSEIERVRTKFGLPDDYLLFVGTLEPRKGIDTLIDAFAAVHAVEPGLNLVIAGKRGWYWQALLTRITDLGIAPFVHVLDYVPETDLSALYSGATVFVLPSRYEGFGLPVLEAMACGVPVITTNTSSLPEVTGDAGIMIPADDQVALADTINTVIGQSALQAEMRARGLERVQRFRWETAAEATVDIYELVVHRTQLK